MQTRLLLVRTRKKKNLLQLGFGEVADWKVDAKCKVVFGCGWSSLQDPQACYLLPNLELLVDLDKVQLNSENNKLS